VGEDAVQGRAVVGVFRQHLAEKVLRQRVEYFREFFRLFAMWGRRREVELW